MAAIDVVTAHGRLGHINVAFVRQVAAMDIGIRVAPFSSLSCEGCSLGKSTKLSVPSKSLSRATRPGQLLHTDLCGALTPCSIGNHLYFMVVVDDYSRLVMVHTLKAKSEAYEYLVASINLTENSLNTSVKTIRSDRGGEFGSNNLHNFLAAKGITHQQPPAESSPQNGVAERFIRTISGLARSMILAAGLPFFCGARLCALQHSSLTESLSALQATNRL